MIAADAGRYRAGIGRVFVISADIKDQRRVGCADQTGELGNGDGIGCGHAPHSRRRGSDAMLRPKPHGAIAVGLLLRTVVQPVLPVNDSGSFHCAVQHAALALIPMARAAKAGISAIGTWRRGVPYRPPYAP